MSVYRGGCIRYTHLSSGAYGITAGPGGGYGGCRIDIDFTLLWGEIHSAQEFRPLNYGVNYIIKAA
jgi:hypothetical protein